MTADDQFDRPPGKCPLYRRLVPWILGCGIMSLVSSLVAYGGLIGEWGGLFREPYLALAAFGPGILPCYGAYRIGLAPDFPARMSVCLLVSAQWWIALALIAGQIVQWRPVPWKTLAFVYAAGVLFSYAVLL